jgi:hypothetical protein
MQSKLATFIRLALLGCPIQSGSGFDIITGWPITAPGGDYPIGS